MQSVPLQTCELPFSPPYDWEAMLVFFRAHKLPYVEMVDDSGYERVISTRHGLGWFRVERHSTWRALALSVWNGTEEDANKVSIAVRKMFDLDANPIVLRKAMKGDGFLSKLWAQYPGLRLARSWSSFETMFAAVLGQVVSLQFGRMLTKELVQAAGTVALHPKTSESIFLFPSVKQILDADLSSVRTSEQRKSTIRELARTIDGGALDRTAMDSPNELRRVLCNIAGIGAWTAEYVAMRGFGDNDAFPTTDYALKQELKRHPEINIDAVRPWRGYAAVALWKNFADLKKTQIENVS
ncbi:DNA-3-methyladenine glycosylase family protein [Acidicapsa dinghuensis]|uniref:DNA-3-methyladenine glycosylase II n=1 Tax=Acidicapsa dinghuensis TaxID=2218256 RepID=A0ABW1EM87_9BACT|nr:AlkA N-terminal domain-containing protein [Acidicapsa dinghuensis]